MTDVPEVYMWRGKRVDELTHEECRSAVIWLGQRVRELESYPIDWPQYARNTMQRSTTR